MYPCVFEMLDFSLSDSSSIQSKEMKQKSSKKTFGTFGLLKQKGLIVERQVMVMEKLVIRVSLSQEDKNFYVCTIMSQNHLLLLGKTMYDIIIVVFVIPTYLLTRTIEYLISTLKPSPYI